MLTFKNITKNRISRNTDAFKGSYEKDILIVIHLYQLLLTIGNILAMCFY